MTFVFQNRPFFHSFYAGLPGKFDKAENMNLEWNLERRGGSWWWRGRRRRRRWWSRGRPKAPGSSRRSSRLPSPATSLRRCGAPILFPSCWSDTRARLPSGRLDRLIPPISKRWGKGRLAQLASAGSLLPSTCLGSAAIRKFGKYILPNALEYLIDYYIVCQSMLVFGFDINKVVPGGKRLDCALVCCCRMQNTPDN